jgi:hypothetical protein
MQDTPSARSPIVKRLLIVAGAVVFVGIAGIATVLILKNIIPKKETGSTTAVIKANEAVAIYSVPGSISGLSDNLYEQQLSTGERVPILYKSGEHAYATSVLTSENVLFYGKNTSSQDDIQSIQNQTAVFMQGKGYEKVANSVKTEASGPSYATYASEGAICQLVSSGAATPEGSPVSHVFACAEKATIEEEYKAIEALLKLYPSKDKVSFTQATRSTVTEKNKTLAILRLATAQKPPALLFVSINDSWSYVGNLSDGNSQSNAKYSMSADMMAKIRDSKYDGFLTKNLLGGTLD